MPELAKRWKQSIVIDNRPGAAGSLAHDFAARAQPDGYTLYINSDTAMAYGATGQSEYDAEKYFVPIGVMANAQNICLGSIDSPAKTWSALVAFAKANPGKVNWGSYLGTINHVELLRLTRMAGMDVTFVPYNNSPAMTRAVLTGEVHIACVSARKDNAELAKSGRLIPLVAMGSERIAGLFPETPTFRNEKIDFAWDQVISALFAPMGTPAAVINKIRADLGEIMKQPDLVDKVRNGGFEPETRPLAETGAMLIRYSQQVKRTVQETGYKPPKQ